MFRIHNLLAFVIILVCLFPLKICALESDAKQKFHIVADSSLVDYKAGTSEYEGNVKVDQGTTHVVADRVTTKNNSNRRIEEAVAYGLTGLAEYWTTPKENDEIFRATAKIIRYFPVKGIVELEGNVTVTQGKSSFQGPLIIYNIKDQVFNAPASKSGRATIIIEPNQIQ